MTDKQTANAAPSFASIVESSRDAIISKDLDGVILTWNAAAQRLFGYSAVEAIGQHISLIIPDDRRSEEFGILERVERGEPVEHYETVRRRKDGSLVEIALTVSPVRNAEGRIIGASKIARAITERREAEAQTNLLLREMDHRVKNAFTIASTILTMSARTAKTPQELATDVGDRLQALARAHALTLPGWTADAASSTTLQALIRTILAPFDGSNSYRTRYTVSGPDLPITGRAIVDFGLLLHEFATNAAKYGALSTPYGFIEIECSNQDGGRFVLLWKERGSAPEPPPETEGFGSLLTRVSAKGLNAEFAREWTPEGPAIRLSLPRNRIAA